MASCLLEMWVEQRRGVARRSIFPVLTYNKPVAATFFSDEVMRCPEKTQSNNYVTSWCAGATHWSALSKATSVCYENYIKNEPAMSSTLSTMLASPAIAAP